MDRIVMQNNMALAAGMTYGKWKALHPESEVIEEEVVELEGLRMCRHCGKPIPHKTVPKDRIDRYDRTLYCSDRCKQTAHNRRKGIPERTIKTGKVDNRPKPGKCQWCGKQIPERNERGRKIRHDTRFCSHDCRMANLYFGTKEAAGCQP